MVDIETNLGPENNRKTVSQLTARCLTTCSEYLAGEGTSIPAFQNALTYILVGLCTLLIQCVDDQGLPTVTLKAKLDYCVIDLRTAAH